MTFDEVCAKVDRVQGFGSRRKGRCPAHDDQVASLSLREADDGKVLLFCHAGCTTKVVAKALGLSMRDLAPEKGAGEEVARYAYHDADGKLLYEKVRYEPKDFRFVPAGYRGHRVPYNLAGVLDPANAGRRIVWVEGEKDAQRLIDAGLVATTAGAAGDWRAEMAPYFAGRQISILPDNDDPGRAHARTVASALAGTADVSICELPGLPPKGDVSDYLDTHTIQDLRREIVARSVKFGGGTLAEQTEVAAETTEWLWFPRIARGAVTMVFGEAGLGKSTIMLDVLARLSRGAVMPCGTEPVPATKCVIAGVEGPISRTSEVLHAAGSAPSNIAFIRNANLPDPDRGPLEQLDHLESEMNKWGGEVLFVDNVSEAFIADTDTNNEFSVRTAMRKLTDFAERTGYAVIMITHPKKGAAFGSVVEAITGSQAFTNLPRTTLFVAPLFDGDGEKTGTCGLAVAKSNLYALDYINTLEYALESKEIGYREGHPVLSPPTVSWRGIIMRDAQRMLSDMRPKKDATAQDARPGQERARMALEALQVPEAGMTWDEIVLAVGPGPSEASLRRVRASCLHAAGNPRWGVRWFKTEPTPQTDNLHALQTDLDSPYVLRNTYKGEEENISEVEQQRISTPNPPVSNMFSDAQGVSNRESLSNRELPVTPREDLSPLSVAEMEKRFMSRETTEEFLARLDKWSDGA